MRKLLTLLLLITVTLVQAQKLEKDADNAATEMCTCFNTILEEMKLHPVLVKMIEDMVELGEQEAQQKFMVALMAMTPEEQQEVMNGATQMEKFDLKTEEHCPGMEAKYSMYDGNEDFEKAVLKRMSKDEECSLPYMFFQLGTKSGG